MKIAGIAVDAYKIPTFRSNLKNAGFDWTEHKGIVKGTVFFKVEFHVRDFKKLEQLIRLSNNAGIRRN